LSDRLERWLYPTAIAAAVLPLWVAKELPIVDLPQHLHLISVLHRLDDPSTLYPKLFAARAELTPYLGYYYAVSFLNWLLPLRIANKLFLSAYVAGVPLSLAFLLTSLRRPAWPSLLSIPFAYGDSFAWGFINYCSAVPLAFLCCGMLVRSIADAERRKAWAAGAAVAMTLTLLFHVQVFAFLLLALPLLLVSTRASDAGASSPPTVLARFFPPRAAGLVSMAPALTLFGIWVVGRIGAPSEIEYGAPWKAWGPMLSAANLSFKSFAQNRADLADVLANQLRDGSDRYPLYAVLAIALASLALSRFPSARGGSAEHPLERWRMLALGALALGLYFELPFDIRGYIYYLNTRYAHLAAAALICALPSLRPELRRLFTAAAAASALLLGVVLSQGFAAFGREASALDDLAPLCPSRPMIMGLVFNRSSLAVNHPVYLHSAAILALERGGATNFSFARTPHSPIRYRTAPPPSFPSEWRPDQFDYRAQGAAYDTFLLRGPAPARIFGTMLGSELELAGQVRDFYLVRRR
jgi:hypothetical protein